MGLNKFWNGFVVIYVAIHYVHPDFKLSPRGHLASSAVEVKAGHGGVIKTKNNEALTSFTLSPAKG